MEYLSKAAIYANNLHHYIELVLPFAISVLEIMGIIVAVWSGISSFWYYIQNSFFKKKRNIQFYFATGLATGLEFKMAAEILKTVLVRDLSELLVLGAVIILRAILSFLIHFEIKQNEKNNISTNY